MIKETQMQTSNMILFTIAGLLNCVRAISDISGYFKLILTATDSSPFKGLN
jgi:hypothetical protein